MQSDNGECWPLEEFTRLNLQQFLHLMLFAGTVWGVAGGCGRGPERPSVQLQRAVDATTQATADVPTGVDAVVHADAGASARDAPGASPQVYPAATRLGLPMTFRLVWSSGSDTFIGIRTYVGHSPRRSTGELTVLVTGAVPSSERRSLSVLWTASAQARNVRFGCAHRREFGGQGLVLQLPDGTRIPPMRATRPRYRAGEDTHGSCQFQLPQALSQSPTALSGFKLVFVPAENLPGWWQDEFAGIPRPRAVLEVDLSSDPR